MGQSLIRTILSEPSLVRLDRLMILMIGLYVFLNPFPRVTSIREICFYSSLGILLLLVCTGRRKFSWSSPFSLPLLLLVIWSIAGIPLAVDPGNSIHDVFAHLLKHVALYYMLVHTFPSQAGLHRLIQILVASVGLFSLGGLVLFYGVLGYPLAERFNMNIDTIRFAGMSANYMGFVLVPAVLLGIHHVLYSEKKPSIVRVTFLICIIVAALATILTQTKGAIIALLASSILIFPSSKKGRIVFIGLICLLVTIIYSVPEYKERFHPSNFVENERWAMWLMYAKIIEDNPIMGTGFGMAVLIDDQFLKTYREKLPEPLKQVARHVSPHNLFVDLTVRLGIVGLLLFVFLLARSSQTIGSLCRRNQDPAKRIHGRYGAAALLAFLLQGLTADASFGPPSAMFYTLLAILTILLKSKDHLHS